MSELRTFPVVPIAGRRGFDVPVELLEARVYELQLELAKREMQLVKYRLALENAGVEPPNTEGKELVDMWKACHTVVSTVSEFTMKLGTAKELQGVWSSSE